tara:strand:+ start:2965 stop:3858 length:894 start_codon:yes stop_codon:yes gene_type:complete
MSLDTLKKSNSLDKILAAVEKESAPVEKQSYVDERLWKPELDKSGNGYAIIRFLPAPDGEEMPWVKLWNHAFQGPTGKWYIENSLTTLNQKDPVSEYNSKLWNSGVESDKEIARKQKRKLQYYSNIYVVSDPKHPENEGKVFLFRYGKKIYEKVMEALQPQFEDETPVNPFDFWEGANFKLKIRKVDGYWNYDKSEFDSASKLNEDDSELDKIWKSEYSLKDFLAASNFKTYDELKNRLDDVLTGSQSTSGSAENVELDDTPEVDVEDKQYVDNVVKTTSTESDDSLDYFQKLAKEA